MFPPWMVRHGTAPSQWSSRPLVLVYYLELSFPSIEPKAPPEDGDGDKVEKMISSVWPSLFKIRAGGTWKFRVEKFGPFGSESCKVVNKYYQKSRALYFHECFPDQMQIV